MITPSFKVSQDDDYLYIVIKAPYAKLSELDIYIDENDFRFYCKPYFLRLNLPGIIIENNDDVIYDFEDNELRLKFEKKNPGELFDGLDLDPLAPVRTKTPVLIEEEEPNEDPLDNDTNKAQSEEDDTETQNQIENEDHKTNSEEPFDLEPKESRDESEENSPAEYSSEELSSEYVSVDEVDPEVKSNKNNSEEPVEHSNVLAEETNVNETEIQNDYEEQIVIDEALDENEPKDSEKVGVNVRDNVENFESNKNEEAEAEELSIVDENPNKLDEEENDFINKLPDEDVINQIELDEIVKIEDTFETTDNNSILIENFKENLIETNVIFEQQNDETDFIATETNVKKNELEIEETDSKQNEEQNQLKETNNEEQSFSEVNEPISEEFTEAIVNKNEENQIENTEIQEVIEPKNVIKTDNTEFNENLVEETNDQYLNQTITNSQPADDEKEGNKESNEAEHSEKEPENNDEDKTEWFIIEQENNDCKYGFAQTKSNVFSNLSEEYDLVIDLPNPDNNREDRRIQRIDDENEKFDDDQYLADYFDETGYIEESILLYAPTYETEYTEEQIETLENLPQQTYSLEKEELFYAFSGLIDILFAYCYNQRINCGEKNPKSGWTISKVSSTLSWFNTFRSLEQVLIASYRRSLCFPLYRNWKITELVYNDLIELLKNGQKQIIKSLLEIRKSFLENDDNRFILNDLYINDYCVWIKSVSDKKLESLISNIENIKITKKMVNFDLEFLEICGQVTLDNENRPESDSTSDKIANSSDEDDDDDTGSVSDFGFDLNTLNLENNNPNFVEFD